VVTLVQILSMHQKQDKTTIKLVDTIIAAAGPKAIPFAVLFIIIFNCGETIKVLCRRDQGKYEISYIRLGISTLFLLIYGIFLAATPGFFSEIRFYNTFASKTDVIAGAGIFYALLGILVFGLGVNTKEYARRSFFLKQAPDYPGNSLLFSHRRFSNISPGLIRNLYEPSFFLVTGLLLGLLHPIIGFPLVFIAICYWASLAVEATLDIEEDRQKAIELHHEALSGPITAAFQKQFTKKRLFPVKRSFFFFKR
jgi:hypothetical protein